jgi:hypothetical protein
MSGLISPAMMAIQLIMMDAMTCVNLKMAGLALLVYLQEAKMFALKSVVMVTFMVITHVMMAT